jgi:hypothetical protein
MIWVGRTSCYSAAVLALAAMRVAEINIVVRAARTTMFV